MYFIYMHVSYDYMYTTSYTNKYTIKFKYL